MLVLTRKKQESVVLVIPPGGFPNGGEITVNVLTVAHAKCQLGIHAPGDVRIHRHELGKTSSEKAA